MQVATELAPSLLTAADFAAAVTPVLVDLGRLATRLVGAADADDVVQEALTRAWRRRCTFDPGRGSLRCWLLAITADQAQRWRVRRAPHPFPSPAQAVPVADRDSGLDVRAAVAGLSPRQRLAVELRYYLDLPVAEVAQVMGVSEGTAKSTLADARARLRAVLEES